jgi:hypothetical protein
MSPADNASMNHPWFLERIMVGPRQLIKRIVICIDASLALIFCLSQALNFGFKAGHMAVYTSRHFVYFQWWYAFKGFRPEGKIDSSPVAWKYYFTWPDSFPLPWARTYEMPWWLIFSSAAAFSIGAWRFFRLRAQEKQGFPILSN